MPDVKFPEESYLYPDRISRPRIGGGPPPEQEPGMLSPENPGQPQSSTIGVYETPSYLGDLLTGPSSDQDMATLGEQILTGTGEQEEQPQPSPKGPSNIIWLIGSVIVAFILLTVLE